jgi:hypothetical protein
MNGTAAVRGPLEVPPHVPFPGSVSVGDTQRLCHGNALDLSAYSGDLRFGSRLGYQLPRPRCFIVFPNDN